jgi:glutathione peroxidase-family protein
MSKAVFILLQIFLSHPLMPPSTVNIFELQFKSINNIPINMSDYQNKHIVVVEFDASNPDRDVLLSLDSMYKKDKENIKIIAVPCLDFGYTTNIENMRKLLLDTLNLSFTITDTGYAKKQATSNQHILMKWITSQSENGHVDNDITESGQIFIISSKGLLYGSLSRQNIFERDLIQFLINNEPAE